MNERAQRLERAFSVPMIVAALLVIPVVAVEASDLGPAWRDAAVVLNWVIWAAFAVELVVMLAVVDDRGAWLRDHPLEVVIVVLTPPLLTTAFASLRVLRVLRLLPLLRLARQTRAVFSLDGLRYVTVLAFVTVMAGGQAFATLEPDRSVGDGLYWAVSTMTTVGYGDVSPTTSAGRVLAVAVMLVGIGFVAVLTGAIAERFLAAGVEPEVAGVEAAELAIQDELREMSARLAAIEAALDARSESGGR